MYVIYLYNEETFGKSPYHTFANNEGNALVHGVNGNIVLLSKEDAISATKNNDSLAYTHEDEYKEFEKKCKIRIYKLI